MFDIFAKNGEWRMELNALTSYFLIHASRPKGASSG